MPKAREALAQSDIDAAVADERERGAWLCEELAGRWERSAAKLRADGSYTVRAFWPPGKKVTCIKPNWEKAANGIDQAAHGLRTVARGIREGWDHSERPGFLDAALRARLTDEILAASANDEAVHGVRFFAGAREPHSVSGVATAIWPCDNYPV